MMQENYIMITPSELGFPNFRIVGFNRELYRTNVFKSAVIHRICFALWTKHKLGNIKMIHYMFLIRFDIRNNEFTITMYDKRLSSCSCCTLFNHGKSSYMVSKFRNLVYPKFYHSQTVDREFRIAHEWTVNDGCYIENYDELLNRSYDYDNRPSKLAVASVDRHLT